MFGKFIHVSKLITISESFNLIILHAEICAGSLTEIGNNLTINNYLLLDLEPPVSLELRHARPWHQVPHVAIVCRVVKVSWTLTHQNCYLVKTMIMTTILYSQWRTSGRVSHTRTQFPQASRRWYRQHIWDCRIEKLIMTMMLTYLMTGVMWLPLTRLSVVSVCLYRHFCPQGHFSQGSPVPCIDILTVYRTRESITGLFSRRRPSGCHGEI